MQIFDYILRFATRQVFICSTLLSVFAAQGSATAAELLMVESAGCVYCAKFDREIAPAYPKTSEGKSAPLRRLQLSDPWPAEYININPATVTPTFILVENGHEIDRLVGYPGDDHFWFLLSEMLSKR